MARLYLVRHGEAAARWDRERDPGLSDLGHAQAKRMAERLASHGPLDVIASPLRRTRETAAPLERQWGIAASVEPAVAEIPSPKDPQIDRGRWLQLIMAGTWPDAEDWLHPWRQGVIDRLVSVSSDSVVVSHFIAINVAVGAARSDDRVVVFRPDHCSITVMETDGGALRLVELGAEAITEVR